MTHEKKAPLVGGASKDNFILSTSSEKVPDLYFSIPKLFCNPHAWASGNHHPKLCRGVAFNANHPRLETGAAPNKLNNSTGANLLRAQSILTYFWSLFQAPMPGRTENGISHNQKSSGRASAEVARIRIKSEAAGVYPAAAKSCVGAVRMPARLHI
jgi:hypothetical protein